MDSDIANYDANAPPSVGPARGPDILDSAIYYRLFDDAEAVRWKMSDIPWSAIDRTQVSEGLINLVCEFVLAELTTWSAANRFFQAFVDDVDFTQWITIWLYEETKHPQVLMRWLKRFDRTFDARFLLEGRKTHPFMPSRMGTLIMNLLSEIEASSAYMVLSDMVEEPVLKLIASNLSADEARHASGFYSYAKKLLDASDRPDYERLEAVKVLYFWLTDKGKVKHPVALFSQRVSDKNKFDTYGAGLGFGAEKARAKMRLIIGNLIGRTLEGKEDVWRAFADFYLITRAQAS